MDGILKYYPVFPRRGRRGGIGSVVDSYAGPGDIVSGASAWWGLRAYSNTAIGGNALDLLRDDLATLTVATVFGGGLDTAVVAWMAGHTATVTQLYDQTGNGKHLNVPSDPAPVFSLTGAGSLPAITFGSDGPALLRTDGDLSLSQPFTTSFVGKRTVTGSPDVGYMLGAPGGVFGWHAIADTVITTGVSASATATDGSFHTIHARFDDAALSLYIDGSNTAGTPGTYTISGTLRFGRMDAGLPVGTANQSVNACELGIWPSLFGVGGGGQAELMDANQQAYWGF